MKKILLFFILFLFCALTAVSATYKVNGKRTELKNVYTPNNRVNVYHSTDVQGVGTAINYVDIVIDYSGSMANWIAETKRVITVITGKLPANIQIGVRTFGQKPIKKKTSVVKKNKNGNYTISYNTSLEGGQNCSATTQALPITYNNAATIVSSLDSIRLGGSTPITLGLRKSVSDDFKNIPLGELKKIILITDAGENCGGDPCAFIRNLVKTRKDFVVDVIYTGKGSPNLKCLTEETNGKFYNITDLNSFENIIYQSISNIESNKQDENKSPYGYVFMN